MYSGAEQDKLADECLNGKIESKEWMKICITTIIVSTVKNAIKSYNDTKKTDIAFSSFLRSWAKKTSKSII